MNKVYRLYNVSALLLGNRQLASGTKAISLGACPADHTVERCIGRFILI